MNAKVIDIHERSRWRKTSELQMQVLLKYTPLPHDLIVELHYRRCFVINQMRIQNHRDREGSPTSSA